MFTFCLFSILAAAIPILGNPAPNYGSSGGSSCQRDPLYLIFLNPLFNSAAVSFCSSYIHVPVATATVSAKITANGPTSSVFVTATATPSTVVITPVSTSTTYVATTTTIVYTTYTPDENFKQKRDSNSPSTPGFCNGYQTNEIFSACSCLSIPTSTKTITATGTVTVPGTTITQTIIASAPPITITGTLTTTTVSRTSTATTALPTLCDPINFQNYTGSNDQRPSQLNTNPSATSIQACCLACYHTQNCLFFIFTGQQCSYYVATTPDDASSNFAYRKDLCPLQVTAGSKELGPGLGNQNYGPCLADSPLEANGCPEQGTIGADYPPGCTQ